MRNYGSSKFTSANIALYCNERANLLLETSLGQEVFEQYNTTQAPKFGREKLEFDKFEAEIEDSKQREIYNRIFREEQQGSDFSKFFNHMIQILIKCMPLITAVIDMKLKNNLDYDSGSIISLSLHSSA